MSEVKSRIADGTIYGFSKFATSDGRAARVNFLLQGDRFISHPDHYEVRFAHRAFGIDQRALRSALTTLDTSLPVSGTRDRGHSLFQILRRYQDAGG